MKPGTRVRVTEVYGEKFPAHARYVGQEGTVVPDRRAVAAWCGYVRVWVDSDDGPGLFLRDEIEAA